MDIVSKGREEHFINLSLNEINGLQICPQSWITVSRTWAAGWMVASKPGRYIKIQLISVSYAFSGCCVKTGRLYQNITVFRGNCPLNHSFLGFLHILWMFTWISLNWIGNRFLSKFVFRVFEKNVSVFCLKKHSIINICPNGSKEKFQWLLWFCGSRRVVSCGFHLGIFAAPRRTRAIGEKAAFFSSFKVLQEYMWHIVYWLKHLFVCLRELLI